MAVVRAPLQPMIVQGVIGGVVSAVGLVIAPAGHMIVTLAWILVGLLEFVALLSVSVGVLGPVMWKRRQVTNNPGVPGAEL